MKVIILKDTPKIGRRDEIKNIPDGYVQNFLIPKGIVERATPKTLEQLEERKKRIRVEKEINEDLLMKNLKALSDVTLTLVEKVSETGHLFSGITKEIISEKLQSMEHVTIDPKAIEIERPIKELGEHVIPVSMHGKSAKFKLVIEKK